MTTHEILIALLKTLNVALLSGFSGLIASELLGIKDTFTTFLIVLGIYLISFLILLGL